MVSDIAEAVDRAGRDREMTYQLLKRGIEIRRDIETTLVGTNKARAAGSATTESECASVQAWLNSNTDEGSGGVDPTGDGTDARTDGTQRAFTESLLETVVDSVWEAGGNPDVVYVGSFNKRAMNDFTGRATATEHPAAEQSIISAMDVYISDYGSLKIVPNRFSRSRDALILQTDMWAVCFLQDMHTIDIARTGTAEKKQIVATFTLEARNEASSGGVFDLTTS